MQEIFFSTTLLYLLANHEFFRVIPVVLFHFFGK